MRAIFALTLLLPLVAATLHPADAQGVGGGYGVTFVCPPIVSSDAAPQSVPSPSQAAPTCPAYIFDAEDVMAQPRLVVDGRDPGLLAFNALHGGSGIRAPTQDPQPTPRSRDNAVHQPHTTFVSTDKGADWQDHRYASPLATTHESQPPLPIPLTPPTQTSNQVFGEDNAMVADRHGKLTIASLYSVRDQAGGPVRFRVVAWREGRIGDALDYDRGYVVLSPTDANATIDSLNAVDVPEAHQTVLAWRETGSDGKAWLQVAHLPQDDGGAQWTLLDRAQRIGPCAAVSNPIDSQGVLYVGCLPAAGYAGAPAKGQAQMHEVFPGNWTSQRIGPTPVLGATSLTLASADALSHGMMVLAGGGIREGAPEALLAVGVKGAAWGHLHDYGPQMTDLPAHVGTPLLEVRINALDVLGASGTVHFLYMERYSVQGSSGQQEFAKEYGVATANGRFLGKFGLNYGDPQARMAISPQVTGASGEDFNDQHDSIVTVHDRTGKERTFVAFGDYGAVRFAEVVEVQPPPLVIPPLSAPVAIPTLAASTSPALVGAAAGALSAAAVLRAALAKSKKAVEAPTL